MKGCLIIPPSAFLLDARVFVSLGVLKVAAALEERGGQVDVLDLSGVANYLEVVKDYLERRPDWVGVTATTPQMPPVMEIVKIVRSRAPETRLVLGGPHATLVSAAYKYEAKLGISQRATKAYVQLMSNFDVMVAGDGEKAIFQAIQDGAFGLIDADDPKGPLFLTERDLAASPLPARHLIDLDSYHYKVDGERATSLIAQLGCPFQCAFCGGRASPMLRRFRTRSTPDVLRELAHLHDIYGYRGFMFYDDELNVSREMPELMRGIASLAASRKTEFKLRGFVKSELFTDEQAETLYRAGFRWLLVGFESGSERILKNINKQATVEDNTRCIQIAKKHGLKVKALMSIGHAGESEETVAETEEWLLRMKVDDFDATIITTYPGTPYYDLAQPNDGLWTFTAKGGDRLHAFNVDYSTTADYYKGDPDKGYRAYVFTDHLCSTALVLHRDRLEARVRKELGIPFNPGAPAVLYEHSMGMTSLPSNILRSSHFATAQGVGT